MGVIKVSDIPVSSLIETLEVVKRPRGVKKKKGEKDLIDIVCAFDIETSTVMVKDEVDGIEKPHSFMYHWQFQLGPDYTIVGRNWETFTYLMEVLVKISMGIKKREKLINRPRFVVYVHNLAFEWQYLQGVYDFKNEDCFFRDVRQPIYAELNAIVIFRCSYLLSNMTLAKFAESMGCKTQKLDGKKFNYNIVRYPWTPIEPGSYEFQYCINDVISLEEAIRIRMEKEGDTLLTIPLTSTGYVRRDCKEALKPHWYQIKQILPDMQTYQLLQRCFRGGNCHCNRYIVGEILKNVHSIDITSSYPAQQLTKKFPMGAFKKLPDSKDLIKDIMQLIEVGNAVIADYKFLKVKLKNPRDPMPYLPIAKSHCVHAVEDNGRVVTADMVTVALTEVDLAIFMRHYDFKEIKAFNAMTATMGPLPKSYRDVIMNYYVKKTELKDVDGFEYEYQKLKNLLNAVYGMSAQRPIHSIITYIDHHFLTPKAPDNEQQEKELAKAWLPYQWGVYTTAYAREALEEAIELIGYDENGVSRHCYSDTDSNKFTGPKRIVDNLNKVLRARAKAAGAYATDKKGEVHYIGEWEYEKTYKKFITRGAKRYAVEYEDGTIKVTCSGVNADYETIDGKKIYTAGVELGKLENFKEGFVFVDAGGLTARYNDIDDIWFEDSATKKKVHITPNVAIIPKTYTMTITKEYSELLTMCANWVTYCRANGRDTK